jgi:hypothetical protein
MVKNTDLLEQVLTEMALHLVEERLVSRRIPSYHTSKPLLARTLMALGPQAFRSVCDELGQDGAAGRPQPLSWKNLLLAGVHPVEYRKHGFYYENPAHQNSHGLFHPYSVASIFLRQQKRGEALQVLDEYDLIKTTYKEDKARSYRNINSTLFGTGFWRSSHDNTWAPSYFLPINPKDHGIPVSDKSPFDTYTHLLWLTDEAVSTIIGEITTPTRLYNMSTLTAFLHKPELLHRVQKGSRRAFRRLLRRSANRKHTYSDMCRMVKLMSVEDAEEELSQLRGARVAIGLVKSDLNKKQALKALRKLCAVSIDNAKVIMRHMEYVPSVAELTKVRSKSLPQILYYMPYEILEQSWANEEERGQLKLHVSRWLEDVDLDTLQNCLVDHDRRLKCSTQEEVRPHFKVGTRKNETVVYLDDWDRAADVVWEKYRTCTKLREELDQYHWGLVLFAVLYLHDDVAPHMTKIAEKHPAWSEVLSIAEGFSDPVDYTNAYLL